MNDQGERIMKKVLGLLFSLLFVFMMPLQLQAEYDPDVFVYDGENVLDEEVKEEIQTINSKLQEFGDAKIYVVTLDSIGWRGGEYKAKKIFKEWKVDSSHSLMLILAIEEGKYFCFSGSELQETFKQSIMDDLLYVYLDEDFDNQNYSDAVSKTVDALYRKAYNMYNKSTSVQAKPDNGMPVDTYAEQRRKESFIFILGIVACIPVSTYIVLKASDLFQSRQKRR